MYGCQITFIKQSITTTITINQSTIGGAALATVFRLQGKSTLQTTYQMVGSNNIVTFIVSSENTWDVINSTNPSVQADQNTYLQDQITALQTADTNFTLKNDLQDSIINGKTVDDQKNLNEVCSKFPKLKIDTDCVIFKNITPNEKIETLYTSGAFFGQTPGAFTFSRRIRAIKEYTPFFIPEIVLLILIVYFLYLHFISN
jgi:hypothetical protein